MCKINTITIDGPNAQEFSEIIAAAMAKQKNTLAVRDEHTAGTLESIPAPIRVATIIANEHPGQEAAPCAKNSN